MTELKTTAPSVSREHLFALAQKSGLMMGYRTAELVDAIVGYAYVVLADIAVQEAFVKANKDAIIAARDEELRKQEPVAWMIECSNAFVGWWNDTTKLDCRYFDADPNKGRRFNTKEEAEELIQSKGNSCMKATGHLWVNEGTLKDGMKLSAAPIPPTEGEKE